MISLYLKENTEIFPETDVIVRFSYYISSLLSTLFNIYTFVYLFKPPGILHYCLLSSSERVLWYRGIRIGVIYGGLVVSHCGENIK